jgi:hypothetical protein
MSINKGSTLKNGKKVWNIKKKIFRNQSKTFIHTYFLLIQLSDFTKKPGNTSEDIILKINSYYTDDITIYTGYYEFL